MEKIPARRAVRPLWERFPLTAGRCRSRIHPSIFFPGCDRSLLGGHGLGRWGWEVGERIARALGAERAEAPPAPLR